MKFGENVGFLVIFSFPGVDWAQKWSQTINFRYIVFLPKYKILREKEKERERERDREREREIDR